MSELPKHLFVSEMDGGLYDTRRLGWARTAIRENYRLAHREIKSTADLKATLRHGAFAWPGGYPLFFITSDGAALSFKTARKELRSILWAIRNKSDDGWRITGCDVNYEGTTLTDAHTGEPIEAAYRS